MANWCSNSVAFTTDAENLKAIQQLFAEIEQKQVEDDRYHLPAFANSEGYMTDIVFNKEHIRFESRWVPNTELMMEIADHFNASFVSRFYEMSNGIFGEARYDGITLTAVNLDMDDFRTIRYDKQKNGYPYEEQVFEYEGDLLDYLLDQKIEKNVGLVQYTVGR